MGTLFSAPVRAQDNIAEFMQAKLKHSQELLKGLVTEDFDLIAKNSQAMSLLCEDELWMVLKTPEYVERSTEFRRMRMPSPPPPKRRTWKPRPWVMWT